MPAVRCWHRNRRNPGGLRPPPRSAGGEELYPAAEHLYAFAKSYAARLRVRGEPLPRGPNKFAKICDDFLLVSDSKPGAEHIVGQLTAGYRKAGLERHEGKIQIGVDALGETAPRAGTRGSCDGRR